jgi:transcriptional regulator with XRE-family HTH domain
MKRAISRKIPSSEVRKIRKELGFSQEEFARFLWVTYSTLNRWEAGRAAPFGLHLRILTLLQHTRHRKFVASLLEDARISDPTFLLYRLLDFVYREGAGRVTQSARTSWSAQQLTSSPSPRCTPR